MQLQRYPAHEKKIPPPKWEEEQLSLRSAAVALAISRKSSAVQHSFQKVRSFEAIKELEAKSRDGRVHVVVGVGLVQRASGGRMDLRAFGRRALLDLLNQTKDGLSINIIRQSYCAARLITAVEMVDQMARPAYGVNGLL